MTDLSSRLGMLKAAILAKSIADRAKAKGRAIDLANSTLRYAPLLTVSTF
jgi:hypothetical protein